MTHDQIKIRNADIVARTLQGQSVNEIIAATNIKYGVIYRALAEAGVAPVKKYTRTDKRSVPNVKITPRKKRGRRASHAK